MGLTVQQHISERKRLVRAFMCKTGAYPEPLRKTGAYICVKEYEKRALLF